MRRAMLARRAALGPEARAAFASAASVHADLIVTAHGGRPAVALYCARADEAPMAAIAARLHAQGVALALPLIGARDAPLRFRAWRPGEPLEAGPFGIQQPAAGAEVVPDVLVVPLLAFDRAGHRLGYGGGYYDRTLAALHARGPVLAIGLAFAAQAVRSVPAEPHDVPLQAVLTETGLAVDRRAR